MESLWERVSEFAVEHGLEMHGWAGNKVMEVDGVPFVIMVWFYDDYLKCRDRYNVCHEYMYENPQSLEILEELLKSGVVK